MYVCSWCFHLYKYNLVKRYHTYTYTCTLTRTYIVCLHTYHVYFHTRHICMHSLKSCTHKLICICTRLTDCDTLSLSLSQSSRAPNSRLGYKDHRGSGSAMAEASSPQKTSQLREDACDVTETAGGQTESETPRLVCHGNRTTNSTRGMYVYPSFFTGIVYIFKIRPAQVTKLLAFG